MCVNPTSTEVFRNYYNQELVCLVYDSGISTAFKLKDCEILSLIAICRYYNRDTNEMLPNQDTIADKFGKTDRTIGNGIKGLVDKGLITKETRIITTILKDGTKITKRKCVYSLTRTFA
jgi:predicted transcriptional regulator